MNSLGRNIEKGEIVVLSSRWYHGEEAERLVECRGGFGMSQVTTGTMLSVKFLINGEEARSGGLEIDKEATIKYQANPYTPVPRLKPEIEEKPSHPFKLMMTDEGGKWIICKATDDPREAFKKFHGSKPSRSARLIIIPLSYGITNGGLNYTRKAGDFDPVRIK